MRLRQVRALVAALVLGSGLLAVPSSAPSPVAGVGPLPACRIDDVPTFPHDYESGPTTLVDHILTVGRRYKPPDLVLVGNAGVFGGGLVRQIAIDDLRAMARAAKDNGTPLVSWSAYRPYRQQVKLFNGYARAYGYDEAITFSARPGHSEHQLGLAIDFVSVGDSSLSSTWESTPTGAWMAKHAWEFGWILSYPKGKTDVTCFSYEPWHYRYVGRDVAAEIHDAGVTIREYLWDHYTLVDPATGSPVPTATAEPSGPASPNASAGLSPAAPSSTAEPSICPCGSLPAASPPPTSNAGAWFGVDPPVFFAGVLLVLASIGLVASLRFSREARRI